jgi:hypothetical protein
MHIKKLNVQYQFHFKAWGVFSQLNSGKIQGWDRREKQEKRDMKALLKVLNVIIVLLGVVAAAMCVVAAVVCIRKNR